MFGGAELAIQRLISLTGGIAGLAPHRPLPLPRSRSRPMMSMKLCSADERLPRSFGQAGSATSPSISPA